MDILAIGHHFASRIIELQERKLHMVEKPGHIRCWNRLLAMPSICRSTTSQWSELVRLKSSIKTGGTAPSVILRKLAAAGPGMRLNVQFQTNCAATQL